MSREDPRTHFPSAGRVEWIGVRSRRGQPVDALEEVEAIRDHGLAEDHASGRAGGRRQVTLMQSEHLSVIETLAERAPRPDLLRRNLLVSGINLRALVGRRFRVGAAVLEGTGDCPPCNAMEAALGFGGRNAMTGMGGVTARVLEGGLIRLGDSVEPYNLRADPPHLI